LSNPFVTATGNRASLIAALVTVSPAALPDAAFATAYSKMLNQSGLLGVPIWSISAGALPPGLTLDATSGVLSGAPTMLGTFNFTVRATSNNYFSEHAYSLHVGQGAPVISVTAPAPNIVGNFVAYSVTVKPKAIGSLTPTGEVQFKLNGNNIGNAMSLVNGIASFSLAAPPTGGYRVSVDFNGDSNYLAGSSTANTQLFVFQYSVRDDRSGDYILFNATAAARNIPRGGRVRILQPGEIAFGHCGMQRDHAGLQARNCAQCPRDIKTLHVGQVKIAQHNLRMECRRHF